MKARIVYSVLGIFLMLTAAALAADVTGKWTAEMPGRQGGPPRVTTFTFKVDGTALTGTTSGGQGGETAIAEGKIDGDNISFVVTMSRGGNDMKFIYKGKVAGNEIKFTRQREGNDQVQEFTAKKAQ